jgi:hypothetical protein
MTNRDPERGEPDLEEVLRALAEDDAQVRAPEHLHARVMATWDVKRHQTPSARGRWVSGGWLGRAAALAAAAVFLVAWIVARRTHGEAPVARTTIPISAATNLMAVPPLETESLQLVRVRMPRGSLRAFGIALVDPDASAEVEVDVIVGEDGFPRSIRRVEPIVAGSQ